jgi:hypothetical protein
MEKIALRPRETQFVALALDLLPRPQGRFAHLSAVWLSTHRGPSQIFHPKRRSTTRTSFNRHWEVSNIDQRVIMPSRHSAVITAPCRHSSVTQSSVAPPPDLTGSIYAGSPWRHGLVVPNASRAWRSSASQSRSARSLPRGKNNGRDVRSTCTVRCRINCKGVSLAAVRGTCASHLCFRKSSKWRRRRYSSKDGNQGEA